MSQIKPPSKAIQILLFFISFPFLSRLWGHITAFTSPRFLVKKGIKLFQNHYKIEMDGYVGDAEDYDSLVNFFTRPLSPETRPQTPDNTKVLSPADGYLSIVDIADGDMTTQVKGVNYHLSDLVRKPSTLFEKKKHLVMTVYLSPANYHRYHAPLDGKATAFCHAKGPLYPVNKLSVANIPGLFVRNERGITQFNTDGHEWYYVAVGATFVGSIIMKFKKFMEGDYHFNKWEAIDEDVKQCDEVGRFKMGSTIILVLPLEMVKNPLKAGQVVAVETPLCDRISL
ncbi:phosphatidylserine decarboxylase [bacterium]|nr:phosphatidylserine decarboxylase [bacterium]